LVQARSEKRCYTSELSELYMTSCH